MKSLKLLLAALAVLALGAPARAEDVEGGLAIPFRSNTTVFTAGEPVHVDGLLVAWVHVLLAEASVPLPSQDVDILVDNVPVKRVTTGGDGAFAHDLVFTAAETEHRIRAVAFAGTLLETSSQEILVTIDRFAIELRVAPTSASIGVGGTVQLKAFATFDEGREQDVTSTTVWSTSNGDIVKVSNADGSRGLVTGIAPGTATVTATYSGLTAPATITVS